MQAHLEDSRQPSHEQCSKLYRVSLSSLRDYTLQASLMHGAVILIRIVDEFQYHRSNLSPFDIYPPTKISHVGSGKPNTSDFDNTSHLTSFVTRSKLEPSRIRRFAISLSIVSCSLFSNERAMVLQVSPGGGRNLSISLKYGLSGSSSARASFICSEHRVLCRSHLSLRALRFHKRNVFINHIKTFLFFAALLSETTTYGLTFASKCLQAQWRLP